VKVQCTKCKSVYTIDASTLPKEGTSVTCKKCQHRFSVQPQKKAAKARPAARKSCPNCGANRPKGAAECPVCGVIYEKAGKTRQKKEPTKTAAEEQPAEKKSGEKVKIDSKEALRLLAVGIICLAIGFFGGREHLKYEIRSTFKAEADKLQKDIKKILSEKEGAGVKKSPSTQKPTAAAETFKVKLISKGFIEADPRAGFPDNIITFTIAFDNQTGKDIDSFEGVLGITDMTSSDIFTVILNVNEAVAADETLEWVGQINYNQVSDPDQKLRTTEAEKLRIVFNTKKINFEDGSTKVYE
jgi:predicted Zn finger-like uncharacterized protein